MKPDLRDSPANAGKVGNGFWLPLRTPASPPNWAPAIAGETTQAGGSDFEWKLLDGHALKQAR